MRTRLLGLIVASTLLPAVPALAHGHRHGPPPCEEHGRWGRHEAWERHEARERERAAEARREAAEAEARAAEARARAEHHRRAADRPTVDIDLHLPF